MVCWGWTFSGVIAFNFDWDAQKLRISKRAPDLAGQRVEIKLAYTDGGMPCITANVGEVRKVRMGVDTGSSNSAALSTVDQLKIVPVASSASHVGYQTIRMEPVFMALGEACGIAAHLASGAGVEARSVDVAVGQREILRRGGVILYEDVPLVPPGL